MGNELDATLSSMLLHDKCPNVAVQEDVKSAKEIECSQYESTAAIFSSPTLCLTCFYLAIPNYGLGPCYACVGHVMGIRET
jgi:hypothetical protein